VVKQTTSHYPCIPWSELPELLAAMRTSELIAARWKEFDFEESLWTIPAERMKGRRGNRREHLVPLSRQAAARFDGGMCGHGFPALAMTNIQEQLGIDLRNWLLGFGAGIRIDSNR
jgi:integrase